MNNNSMKHFETIEGVPAQVVYHYTSLEALYSIVTNRSFRLTSLKSSNDATELFYKPETFICNLENIIANETDELTKQYLFLIKNSVDKHKDEFFKECRRKSFPYALCLSKKRDNLTHWDRYANSCTGVCIGFNVSALNVLMQRLAITSFGVGVYDVGDTLYASECKDRLIKKSLLSIINEIVKQDKMSIDETINLLRDNGYIYAIGAYRQISKFVKDQSFVDEDEVRLFHDSASVDDTVRLLNLMKEEIHPELYVNLIKHFNKFVSSLKIENEKYYVSTRGIRCYKNLCLSDVWGEGTIPEIILGPMCSQSKEELKRFLKANGLGRTKVLVSDVPIR